MLFFDPTSARATHSTWKTWHLPWLILVALVFLGMAAWYALSAWQRQALPGGSSAPGLASGILAGVLFLYLFTYGLRKKPPFSWWYGWFPTKFWLAQHIWFGLLTFPLVALHCALLTRWGGIITTALMVVYFAVFLSGVWGLWLQQTTPRRILQEIPDESNYYQLDQLGEQLRLEASLLVMAACGPGKDPRADLAVLEQRRGVVKAARQGKGTGVLRAMPAEPLKDAENLRNYFDREIEPYLNRTRGIPGSVRLRSRMKSEFADLRRSLAREPGAVAVIDSLEAICDYRHQFDEQAQLHRLLHGWIGIHLSLSAVLLVFLATHAITAVWYW